MSDKDHIRNITLFQIQKIFGDPLFWCAPIIIAAIMRLGHMSLAETYTMEAWVIALYVLVEVPSGTIADLLGYKYTILTGRVLMLVGMIYFAIMTCPLHAWIS